ncbi:tRNA (N6-adenosine(37)-N6)-threonylcarbamoyltransferase complex ATPase TsaE [Marinobacterium nitratireducens]|uniref:tRNA threonylcarbamoyladenosine biosynthesis protein TsaE n=2 Tax=Marinobacterium nitratireducens TaxID=518897 RepID=A0A917ZME3_9GAMM|nr:tRNA (N6-adenosine(37)-N6)-threonylcarbamoyltransferase complex ATPase TsaE [Marinobacterium nitratireducens]
MEHVANGETAMVAFGEALGRACEGRGVIFLEGDLGMGKTTLCRGVLRAYGHRGAVKSPTYTLVEPYELGDNRLYHFDLYRLADPEELEYLGIRDYFAEQELCLVEWPARGAGMLPVPDLTIQIQVEGEGRRICCQAMTQRGRRMIALLQAES